MGYVKADEILPEEIIELIQQYVDGQNIYIPKKTEKRAKWGSKTAIRQELASRNQCIYEEYCAGAKIAHLAAKYFLSEKSIQRIINTMKQKTNELSS